jgi:hypothetical protein
VCPFLKGFRFREKRSRQDHTFWRYDYSKKGTLWEYLVHGAAAYHIEAHFSRKNFFPDLILLRVPGRMRHGLFHFLLRIPVLQAADKTAGILSDVIGVPAFNAFP